MAHPGKWRETEDPFSLDFHDFQPKEILGYPHAGNDVFHVKGIYRKRETEAYLKIARRPDADIRNEVLTIRKLRHPLCPKILDHDSLHDHFLVTEAMPGQRLSVILGNNASMASLSYLEEYGQTLALLHRMKGGFPPVKDRKFFHPPDEAFFRKHDLGFAEAYLKAHPSKLAEPCFCHGDFHYANLLWENGRLSAILDWELSGMGCREYDMAWAIVRRPGQTFLRTREEINLFLSGYRTAGAFDPENFARCYVQIACYFYEIGRSEQGYQEEMKPLLHSCCEPGFFL